MGQSIVADIFQTETIEFLHIEWLNTRKNKVEMTMRLRALAEISGLLDTDALMCLCEYLSKGGDCSALAYRG
jgi:hypothetical protein